MKNFLFGTVSVLISTLGIAQTNTFPTSGNVGVGTTSPGSKLHIAGDGAVIKLQDTSHENTTNGFRGWLGGYDKSGNEVWWIGEGSSNNKVLGFYTNRDGYDLNLKNKGKGIVIKNSGNVGIGTNLPGYKMVISNNGAAGIEIDPTGIQFSEGTGIQSYNRSTSSYTPLQIYSSKLVLGGGNVGIGTTSPDSKLTVKGKIHAEEVKVDLSVPAPDYVFTKDYDLLTIEEIQQHIKEKGHLPNIPSAIEMEKNGVALGVMNMKLLEKIEELTLYTIAQEKQLKEQQKVNKVLEGRLKKIENLLIKKK